MQKQIYKILFLIFFSPILLFIFINNSMAFLDSDLGLNLYKNLDSGLKDLENSQYVYELSGKDKKDISKNINKLLKKKGINDCFESGINTRVIDSIVNGNIDILIKHFKKEKKCGYNVKTKKFDLLISKEIGILITEVSKIKSKYKNKAEQKAKAIHEISRIGIYSDGSTKNSPFDLIKDIQNIDKIIFSEDIRYQGEDNSFLSALLKKDLNEVVYDSPNNLIKNKTKNKNNIIDSGKIKNKNNENNISEDSYLKLDGNNYVCKNTNSLDSGLNRDSLNALKNSLNNNNNNNNNNKGFTFNYSNGGHLKLLDSNKITIPDLNDTNSFLGLGSYNKINDNNSWKCNQFFCIVIDFVINKYNALGYSSDKSIENILKTSNKHLKKAANTSLVQSKMSTNNFEMNLRDLDLPGMFHMGFIITKKAPPILNLENISGKSKTNKISKNSDFINSILRAKYKSFGLDYDSANNINKFLHKEKELLGIIHSLENPSIRAENLKNKYGEILNLETQIENYETNKLSKSINNDILKEFDIEFTELEQFSSNILDYANNIDLLIKNLKEIPIYNG